MREHKRVKQRVWKNKSSERSKRMGWKSKRNKEIKVYITIFLACAFIAGVVTLMTGKNSSSAQNTKDKQIATYK